MLDAMGRIRQKDASEALTHVLQEFDLTLDLQQHFTESSMPYYKPRDFIELALSENRFRDIAGFEAQECFLTSQMEFYDSFG